MIFQRINFHDNVLPVFKENKAKGYVTFGADNLYPEFLIELFNFTFPFMYIFLLY